MSLSSASPEVIDGRLKVSSVSYVDNNATTRDTSSLQRRGLKCGQFTDLGNPPIQVVWQVGNLEHFNTFPMLQQYIVAT